MSDGEIENERQESSDDENKNDGQYDDEEKNQVDDQSSENEVVKPKSKKSKKKSKNRGKRSRFIDDAAEESDEQGGVRDNDDEDDDDEDEESEEEEDDLKKPGRKRLRNKFIVDDDEGDEEGVTKEKIIITEREKRLDKEDFQLIADNTGIALQAPDDDDDDDEPDDDLQKRRRITRGKSREEEEDFRKITKKRFNNMLGDDVVQAPEQVEARRHRRDEYSDSEDSMSGFIEHDMSDGEAAEGPRQRRRGAKDSFKVPAQKHELALDVFGPETYSDSDDGKAPEAPGGEGADRYAGYEPEERRVKFITAEDLEMRGLDEPERLQVELKGRFPLGGLDDVREEAEWMCARHTGWRHSEAMDDIGDGLVDWVDPDTRQVETLSKTDRAHRLQARLTDKLANVLCYLRGVENPAIMHGPITVPQVDDKGPDELPDPPEVREREWEYVGSDGDQPAYRRRLTAKLDVPFIQRYRQEYWRDDLVPQDLWRVLDLDARWSALSWRRHHLAQRLAAAALPAAAARARAAQSEEALSDAAAQLELAQELGGGEGEGEGGTDGEGRADGEGARKAPVRVSRVRVSREAGLDRWLASWALAPDLLAENLQAGHRLHEPAQPAQDPVTEALEVVEAAAGLGFRSAEQVVKGAVWLGARMLAAEPGVREHVRASFAGRAVMSVTPTAQARQAPVALHRPLLDIVERVYQEVEDDRLVMVAKARQDGLVSVAIRFPTEDRAEVLRQLEEAGASAAEGADGEWNLLRREMAAEALDAVVVPALQEELLAVRTREAKDRLAARYQRALEAVLETAPYSWCPDTDSKRLPARAIMAVVLGQPSEAVVIDPHGQVTEFRSMNLRLSYNVRSAMPAAEAGRLKELLGASKPDVVVVGASDVRARGLVEQLRVLVDEAATARLLPRTIDVLLADQAVAQRYAASHRAAAEFDKYPPARRMAVSLARRLQDPLRELAGLWAGGPEDVASLPLDPLQDCLDPAHRRRVLERAFVNTVNQVGVDINEAVDQAGTHAHTLQFLSGMGPRKAMELLQVLKQTGCVQYRLQLLEDESVRGTGMRNVVWTNAAGFLRISNKSPVWNPRLDVGQDLDADDNVVMAGGGPLEGTRIHPESYSLARKMATDALDDDNPGEGDEAELRRVQAVMRPDRLALLDELDLEAYAELIRDEMGLKQHTLADMLAELKAPFADPRRSRHALLPNLMAWELTPAQQFDLLTLSSHRLEMPTEEQVRRAEEEGGPPPEPVARSSLVGTAVFARVVHVHRPRPRHDAPAAPPELPTKVPAASGLRPAQACQGSREGLCRQAVCRLEMGLSGLLERAMFGDDEAACRAVAQALAMDQVLHCVVVHVDVHKFEVTLSHRARDLREAEGGLAVAPPKARPAAAMLQTRAISHPSFRNLSRDKVVELLGQEDPGEFLIRPSASGLDKLTITRKVAEGVFADTLVQMLDQANPVGLGRVLVVERMRFEDLDELVVAYVHPVAAHDRRVLEHDKFDGADPDGVAEHLRHLKRQGPPSAVPYRLGFSRKMPGAFAIYFLPGTTQVAEEEFRAVPDGYRSGGLNFPSLNHLLNWWKQATMARLKQGRSTSTSPQTSPPPARGYAGSGSWGPRR